MSFRLIILWAIFLAFQPSASNSEVCNTPQCHEIAAEFRASMETTIDPCVNFHQYVCGRWSSANPRPKHINRENWESSTRRASLAETRLRDELQSAASSSDSQSIKKMKKFYETCMKETSEFDSLTRIHKMLYETGGWPMVMNSNQSNADCRRWQAVDQYYAKILGDLAFFTISLAEEHPSHNQPIQIDHPSISGDLFKKRDKYRSLIKHIADTFIQHSGTIVYNKQLEKDIDDLMRFEEQLYLASVVNQDILEEDDVEILIKKFHRRVANHPKTGVIDWNAIFKRLFGLTDIKPTDRAPFRVKSLDYFVELRRLLMTTDKRTIINYVQWESLRKILPHSSKRMKDLFYELENDFQDNQNKPPRWLHCVNQIGRNHASYSLFIKKYYTQNSRKAADDLYNRLRESWKDQWDISNWMSRETKNATKQRIDSLSAVLGYSSFYEDDQKINDYFKGLEIGDSYFENSINFMKHVWMKQLKNWGKPVRSVEVLKDPLEQLAEYRPLPNTFYLSPVFTQSPLFDGTLPKYITYAEVGSTIGHEMSHLLDFNDFAEILSSDETSFYDENIQCFVDIYDTYFRMAEITHGSFMRSPESRGEITQNENVADWSGLQIASWAYKEMKNERIRWRSDTPKVPRISNEELKLPGFEEYTDEQMFFISYAQSWCSEHMEDDWEDIHSPNYLRIIVPLAHTADFAAAFNCLKNSPMNPEEKCNLWRH